MKNPKKRVMVFGTFDGLHEGHLNFFLQARKLAENTFLVVSIARDRNVLAIKSKIPNLNEKKRLDLVRGCDLVDKAILASEGDHIPHIVEEHPDIIALGYDQKYYTKNLREDLKNKGLNVKIVRLKPYKEKVYKNNLLKRKI